MRSRLIKALNNRFYVKFMQLEIGLLVRQIRFNVRIKHVKRQVDVAPNCNKFGMAIAQRINWAKNIIGQPSESSRSGTLKEDI